MVSQIAEYQMKHYVTWQKMSGLKSFVDREENTIQIHQTDYQEAKDGQMACYCVSGHIVIHDIALSLGNNFFRTLNHEYLHRIIHKITGDWEASAGYDRINELVDRYHTGRVNDKHPDQVEYPRLLSQKLMVHFGKRKVELDEFIEKSWLRVSLGIGRTCQVLPSNNPKEPIVIVIGWKEVYGIANVKTILGNPTDEFDELIRIVVHEGFHAYLRASITTKDRADLTQAYGWSSSQASESELKDFWNPVVCIEERLAEEVSGGGHLTNLRQRNAWIESGRPIHRFESLWFGYDWMGESNEYLNELMGQTTLDMFDGVSQ